MHSAGYRNPAGWEGKRVVVVGASTTACDICHDCSQAGIDVTMVQRGHTRIYPQGHIASAQLHFWNDKAGADLGDIMTSEDPLVLQASLSSIVLNNLRDNHE